MVLCHICYNITGRKFVTKKGFHVLEFKREVKAVEYSITSGVSQGVGHVVGHGVDLGSGYYIES